MKCKDCKIYKERHNCRHECMFLPDGKTCADCRYFDWCSKVYGVKEDNISCDFEPIRFQQKEDA